MLYLFVQIQKFNMAVKQLIQWHWKNFFHGIYFLMLTAYFIFFVFNNFAYFWWKSTLTKKRHIYLNREWQSMEEKKRRQNKRKQTIDWNTSVVYITIYNHSPVSIWLYTIYSLNYHFPVKYIIMRLKKDLIWKNR